MSDDVGCSVCGNPNIYALGRCHRDYHYRHRNGHDRDEDTLVRDAIRSLERRQLRESMSEGYCCDLIFLDHTSWVVCERRENHIGERHRADGFGEWFWSGADLFRFPEASQSLEVG